MDKETSSRVSTIASRLVHTTADTVIAAAQSVGKAADFADEIQALAGSCLSQDETPGQEKKPDDFKSRLLEERAHLSGKLDALTLFLGRAASGGAPAGISIVQLDLLERQRHHMGEYLSVLDQRIADLGIAERTVCLRKLLEAKDAGVRANLPAPGFNDGSRVKEVEPEIDEPREIGGHDEDRSGPVPFES